MRAVPRLLWTAIVVAAVLGVGALAGLITDVAGRDAAFTIDRFEVDVTVTPAGRLEVLETLEVTFHESRRGIFRDLPSSGPLGRGQTTIIVHGVDTGNPDVPWNWASESLEDGRRIRIGDAAVWLDPGTYLYRIRYDIDGLPFTWADRRDVAEVRLNVPGFEWPTDVGAVRLTMRLPGPVDDVVCVAGPARSVRACDVPPRVDGSIVTAELGPFAALRAATIAVQLDPDTFALLPPVTGRATPLGERGLLALPALDLLPVPAGILLALVLMIPFVLLELLKSALIYRDEQTDPHLHRRVQPTAIFAPPHDHDPVEVAGLLLRSDAQAMLIGTLIELDQRHLVHTSSRGSGKSQSLTVRPAPPGVDARVRPVESAFLAALLPAGRQATFNGTYSKDVATRTAAAQAVLGKHGAEVFRRHGYEHDRAPWLRSNGARSLIVLGSLAWLGGGAYLAGPVLSLHRGATFAIAFAVLIGLGAVRGVWRHHRLPLNSAGRDAVGQARSFREFLATVEAEQLEWAASQPSVDTRHPAVRLLPYAVLLGFADSWYARFGPLIRELAAATGAGAAAGTAWWTSQQSFRGVQRSSSGTTTAPSSSSGGGGGGGGSGGGGGGGGSW